MGNLIGCKRQGDGRPKSAPTKKITFRVIEEQQNNKQSENANSTKLPVRRRFSFDAEGYSVAQAWLKEIGEWERVSTFGFSTDGWSIIETANVIWEKRNGG